MLRLAIVRRPICIRRQFSEKRELFKQSVLPNGIRIASVNTPGACIGAGMFIETRRNAQLPPIPGLGASRYSLEKLSFKATRNLSEQKMHARLDALVGAVQTKAHRESILYSGAVVPSHLKQLMELLNEVVTQPLITSKDLKEMQAVIGYELDELKAKPDDLLPELAHGPAFYSSHAKQIDDTMFMDWNSIVGIPQDLQHVTVESVMEYWRTMYTSQNMIVVGAGLPHGELYNAAMDTFGKIEKTPLPEERNLDLGYVGGNQYIENDELPLVHMCVGFEGAKASSEQTYSMAILQMLMGGGSSFSAGGPGKGMYSRLYTQVLNRYHWIDSCKIFNFSYPTSGMFGIHGSALPSHSRDLAQLLLNQLHGMTLPLTNIEVERAKNQVKSAVLMGLESRLVELEDLGDQICNLKKYVSPNEICERIDAVSAEELRRTVITVLNSKPTVVAYGPLHRMPPYDMILKWHHAALKHDL